MRQPIPPIRIILVVGVIIVVGVFFFLTRSGQKPTPPPAVTLSVWGTEAPELVSKLTGAYSGYRPNVTINYRQIPEADYDQSILQALAEGTGPDVFFLPNTALPRSLTLLTPAPTGVISPAQIRALFPDVVADDFIQGSDVYALPVYLDTLSLLANREILDQAGIVNPPGTWNELLTMLPRLRVADPLGKITRGAIALGLSSDSVRHAPDILSFLMLQNGTLMTSADGSRATFADVQTGGATPGLQALNFYLQFADATSAYHAWDPDLGNSQEAFAAGKVAFLLGYRPDLNEVRVKAPFLRTVAAPAPQSRPDLAVNLAHYSGLAVAKRSANPAWSWDFVNMVATNSAVLKDYLAESGHSPALRSLLTEAANAPGGEPIARAALTARSWREPDDRAVASIFDDLIRNIKTGARTPESALRFAADRVSELMRPGRN